MSSCDIVSRYHNIYLDCRQCHSLQQQQQQQQQQQAMWSFLLRLTYNTYIILSCGNATCSRQQQTTPPDKHRTEDPSA